MGWGNRKGDSRQCSKVGVWSEDGPGPPQEVIGVSVVKEKDDSIDMLEDAFVNLLLASLRRGVERVDNAVEARLAGRPNYEGRNSIVACKGRHMNRRPVTDAYPHGWHKWAQIPCLRQLSLYATYPWEWRSRPLWGLHRRPGHIWDTFSFSISQIRCLDERFRIGILTHLEWPVSRTAYRQNRK